MVGGALGSNLAQPWLLTFPAWCQSCQPWNGSVRRDCSCWPSGSECSLTAAPCARCCESQSWRLPFFAPQGRQLRGGAGELQAPGICVSCDPLPWHQPKASGEALAASGLQVPAPPGLLPPSLAPGKGLQPLHHLLCGVMEGWPAKGP